ncbi:membrane-associated protein, putative [Bodo saltans]|uniref:Membrane-associated protein, putative n=1 Tax=Bodo saltans TaxID=75058 RepID=A0A0S4IM03_BODSA|nr:membrane-associated protein, putative [Bodo saltans]|eukprot:CUE71558.1 membrane-associated protein, putative [Bodo saltans]
MRNFQEEIGADGKRKSNTSAGFIAQKLGIDDNRMFQGLVGVFAVSAIVIGLLLVAFTSGSGAGPAGSKQPKAIIVIVPGLNPVVLESALNSNKAANLAGLVTSGAAYGRIASNATDPTAALVSLLSGTAASYHNVSSSSALGAFQSSAATSFLRYLNEASLKTTLIASANFYSGSTYNTSGQCSTVGTLDAECAGIACPSDATSAYCNSATRVIVNNDDTALMSTIISNAFSTAAPGNSLVTIVVDAFSSLRALDDNSLRALSATALLDGVVGQLVLAAEQRSYKADENWLVTLVGDGVNSAQQAPLFVIPVSAGSVIRAKSINTATGNIVDIFPTIASWFNLPTTSSFVVGSVQGICGDGRTVSTC